MNPPRRLRGAFGICNLGEGFVQLREGFVEAPWRLREAFLKTRSVKASRSPLEGFVKPSRRVGDSSNNDKRLPIGFKNWWIEVDHTRYIIQYIILSQQGQYNDGIKTKRV